MVRQRGNANKTRVNHSKNRPAIPGFILVRRVQKLAKQLLGATCFMTKMMNTWKETFISPHTRTARSDKCHHGRKHWRKSSSRPTNTFTVIKDIANSCYYFLHAPSLAFIAAGAVVVLPSLSSSMFWSELNTSAHAGCLKSVIWFRTTDASRVDYGAFVFN